MLTRLTHAAIAFAMTVVVYQAYVLLAVPFIEPPERLAVGCQLSAVGQKMHLARRFSC